MVDWQTVQTFEGWKLRRRLWQPLGPMRLILSRSELPMPSRRLFRRLIRRPLGLPIFEVFFVGLILLGLLMSLLLPVINWIRNLTE